MIACSRRSISRPNRARLQRLSFLAFVLSCQSTNPTSQDIKSIRSGLLNPIAYLKQGIVNATHSNTTLVSEGSSNVPLLIFKAS